MPLSAVAFSTTFSSIYGRRWPAKCCAASSASSHPNGRPPRRSARDRFWATPTPQP